MAGKRLRILELSTEGSVQRLFIDPLAAHLRRQGHEVFQVNGATLSIRRHISLLDLVAVLRCRWRLWRLNIDVLHVQTAKAGAVGRIAAWLAGTPRVVYTAHDFPFHNELPDWRRRFYIWIERKLAHLCQAITVDSPAVKNRAIAAKIAPEWHIKVIPVGVDTAKFTPQPREKHRIPVIGTVARLVPEKGIDVLLRTVRWSDFPCRVVIVGDGPCRHDLEAQAADLGLPVQFVGEQEDVRPYLNQMDIFVLPTKREGLSVAVLEAMSMECCALVSDLPAFQYVVLHQRTGLVAKPHEWVRMLRALLMLKPHERAQMGKAARAHVQQYYEQAVQCRKYEQVLCP